MTTPLLIAILVSLYLLITAPLVIFPCMLASMRNKSQLEKWESESVPDTEGVIYVLDKSDLLRELFQDGEVATQPET
jgi:hypothetical protein